MKKTKQAGLLIASLFLLYSCIATKGVKEPAEYRFNRAEIVVSPNYQYSKEQRIIVMPVAITGKEGNAYDLTLTDKFMVKIMELGLYTIIDRGLIAQFFQKHNISENELLDKAQLELISKELNVDLIFYGTIKYYYKPSVTESSDSIHKFKEGYYSLDSESLKAIATKTGEVVIVSYTEDTASESMSDDIIYAIKKKLAPVVPK